VENTNKQAEIGAYGSSRQEKTVFMLLLLTGFLNKKSGQMLTILIIPQLLKSTLFACAF